MPKFVLTDPQGKEYDVEAPDVETATKEFAKFRQERVNQQYAEEAKTMPPWKIPLETARDVATVAADTATLGFGTKAVKGLFGGEPEMDVAARRARMPISAPVVDIATMAGAFPTAVPKAVGMLGGGPAARALTGTAAAAVEGGAVGGAQSAGHDEDVGSGVVTGMLGGAAGQQIGPAINKGYKFIRGIDDVPKGIRSGLPTLPKNASAADKVTVASNEAASRASAGNEQLGYQTNVRRNIEDLLRTDKKSFTPEQQKLMERVVSEDPATKIARAGGNILHDKFLLGGAGAGILSGNPVTGAMTAAGLYGAGRALKEVSEGGTKEAMDDLLRAMRKGKKYQGILSPESSAQTMKGTRQLWLEDYPEY